MGRKEFYERLEELNNIRKSILEKIDLNPTRDSKKLLNQIEQEISCLKLLQQQ